MKRSLGAKTVLYPTPVLVVGTYGPDGSPNVMTAAWGGIACSRPPCVAVSLRSATASHANMMSRRAFTVSIPAEEHAGEVDYFGLVSGRDHDKFEDTGLTAQASEVVDAPYVSELPIVLECEVVAVHELGLHTQFVGEIMDVKAEERVLDPDGGVDVQMLRPFMFAMGPGRYYGVGRLIGDAYGIGKAFKPSEE
jgi:flavin reductase (DIM6/NTAB) family NADH-FMN oxidoreductase RutF